MKIDIKNNTLLLFFVLISLKVWAQAPISIIQEQNEFYHLQGHSAEDYYSINAISKTINNSKQTNTCQLNKMVFGWHPYWQNGYEANYDWNLISDFCYFSYEVDAATGNATNTHAFETTAVVTAAQNSGTNVHLCVTLFSNHATFLQNPTAEQTLIDNLITLISNRSAKGVNIDFEAVSSTQKNNLTSFMIDLSVQMHAAIPDSKVSIDLPAVDWNSTFDVGAMAPYVDYFMIMGYDYYWGGSSEAGPHAPLYTFASNYDYNLSKSISFYTHAGAPSSQLVLGVPYYGREWQTQDNNIPSTTLATGSTITYKSVKNNTSGHYTNRLWDINSQTPYYIYNDGNWNQCFSDDEESLKMRYEMVHTRSLAGIGIWALGYDDGYTELWDAISEKLSDCRIVNCTDTLYDLGGPHHNYYNYEDYTYTIAPTGAVNLTLDFVEFELENGWDTLWIYDGSDINAPEIGNYTGLNSPGLINASGASLTLKFHSDIATTAAGYKAIWQCYTDQEKPICSIEPINTWQTEDFSVQFIDSDNEIVENSFYQVVEDNGTSKSANTSNGFLFEDFQLNLNSWILQNGSWSNPAETLNQTDELTTNSNAYTSVIQEGNSTYLYQWKMKISGTGANRRAGIYFFSDDATQTQRNNAYMVYFRVDNNKCQIYRADNNTLNWMTDDTCVVDADVWYDYKVIYEPSNGRLRAYQNDQLVSQWTDISPLTNGAFVSLRTGECNVFYDDFRVYKSRGNSVNVSIGDLSDKDVRIQNSNPTTPSCEINTLNKDINDNFSILANTQVNIDWTNPSEVPSLNDGLSTDIDTSFSNATISANWQVANDVHSGIVKYWYSVGTIPGVNDVLAWTDNLENINFTESISLNYNQLYYTSIRAENGAGLLSNVFTSDGLLIWDASTSILSQNQNSIKVYPNPVSDYLNIDGLKENSNIQILDLQGKVVKEMVGKPNFKTNVRDLNKGAYLLKVEGLKMVLIVR